MTSCPVRAVLQVPPTGALVHSVARQPDIDSVGAVAADLVRKLLQNLRERSPSPV